MATLSKYKVLSAKGFHFGGKRLDRGTVFDAESKSAHITTALHFQQIAEVTEKPAKEPETVKPPK